MQTYQHSQQVPFAPSLATLGPVLELGVPALSRAQCFTSTFSQLQKSCSKVPPRLVQRWNFLAGTRDHPTNAATPLRATDLFMFLRLFYLILPTPRFQNRLSPPVPGTGPCCSRLHRRRRCWCTLRGRNGVESKIALVTAACALLRCVAMAGSHVDHADQWMSLPGKPQPETPESMAFY